MSGDLIIRRSALVKPGKCKILRDGKFFAGGPLAMGLAAMRPGDTLLLSGADYRRHKAATDQVRLENLGGRKLH